MSLRKPDNAHVDVDMVPLIDIISLLLMFLIVVGSHSKLAEAVQVNLPRADQGVNLVVEGRLTVSLRKDDGVYRAVINNFAFDLVEGGRQKALLDYLEETRQRSEAAKLSRRLEDGSTDMPVKLRIPEDAPMKDAEMVLMTLSLAGFRNVHYGVLNNAQN